MQQIAQSNVSKAQSRVGKSKSRHHAEGYPGMQRVFEIARRRGAVNRIERHRDTDDDSGKGGVDTGFQNTDPDAYADQHISGSAGYARQVERHEDRHTEAGQGQSDQR